MHVLIFVLLLAAPAYAAEICVQSAESWCCHPNCDLPSFTAPSGFRTDGPPSCGAWGELRISSSSTDPSQSQGGLETPLGSLYLWAEATGGYGFSAAEVTVVGELPLFQFIALHESVWLDPETPIFATTWTFGVGGFGTGCLQSSSPTLLAELQVITPTTPVEPGSWGRVKALWR